MLSKSTLPVIQKETSIPTSGDYDQLLKEGLERISEYSGDLWNNYNTGDPGVTILQAICYALTELSYKTDLPIEDILTDERGKINYENRFVKPQDILPSPPITLEDHKRVILDEIYELKQVYFNLPHADGLFNTFRPYLELKPSYASQIHNTSFTENILTKVNFVLKGQENLGQLFLDAQLLAPQAITLSGSIYLQSSVDVENFIAQLFFQLNHYLSPYPVFYNYEELLAQGKTNDEIFEGPLLKGGFILDDNFEAKRAQVSSQAIMVLINDLAGVDGVAEVSLSGQQTLDISFDQAPYISLDAFFASTNELQLIQNGRTVRQISQSKVEYQLKSILPQPQPSTDFDEYLPQGTYRKIKDYYSIQHHFPEIYKLDNSSYLKHADDIRSAKIKQLKAYLALFEQTMANYLAQLSQVGDLFSFDSGRTVYQLAGKTYYFQDLYDVPGIQELLKEVKGYSKQYNERSEYEDWKAYRRDYLNPYRQQLMAAMESPNINLDRKISVLKHLLARYGVEYDGNYLAYNNPDYGDSRTADVDQISTTLKQFPLLSANRARTYFQAGEIAIPFACDPADSITKQTNSQEETEAAPSPFFSGLELLAGNELNLNSYYQGIEEAFLQALEEGAETLMVLYYDGTNTKQLYPTPTGGDIIPITNEELYWVNIYQDNKLLLSFPYVEITNNSLSQEEIEVLFKPYIDTLSKLRSQCQGFLFIDHIQLLNSLYFSWEVASADGTAPLHKSQILTLDQFEKVLSLIKNSLDLVVTDLDDLFLIENASDQAAHPIAKSSDRESAHQLRDALLDFRSGREHALSFHVHNENWDQIELPFSLFENRVSALFPNWIASFREASYQSFLNQKLQKITPLNIYMNPLQFINKETMDSWLDLFSDWMRELQDRQSSYTTDEEVAVTAAAKSSKHVAWEILKKMNKQHEGA